MEDIHLKSLNKKNITPLRQQTKLMFLTPDLFPFPFFFFRFCCPGFKRSMTADSLTIPTKLLLNSSSSFSPRRAPQHVLWKPWRPTQSGAKRQRPFRRGGPGAVQLRAWLRAGRPRHAHLHHQCWKHCRLGLSCANLSRYAQHDTCLCVAVPYMKCLPQKGKIGNNS